MRLGYGHNAGYVSDTRLTARLAARRSPLQTPGAPHLPVRAKATFPLFGDSGVVEELRGYWSVRGYWRVRGYWSVRGYWRVRGCCARARIPVELSKSAKQPAIHAKSDL
ncbi:hypothetical protein T484DRAFT_2956205 [Baffinella frigidus]|nr:hypothetical protein T484DRAFT_2956205 [Cryptophyta sp. CCMP2293]